MAVPIATSNGVLVADGDGLQFRFTCAQWSLMTDAERAPWSVLENTCGQKVNEDYPFASSAKKTSFWGRIKALIPLKITISAGGVATVGFLNQQPGYFLGVDPLAAGPEYPVFQPLPASIPIESFLDRLPTYPNNDRALLEGLEPGNLYWLGEFDGEGVDVGLEGSLMRVTGAPDPGDLSLLEIMLNDYPDYVDNDAAVADGKVAGNLYWLAEGTEVGLEGQFMRVVT